MKRFYSLLIFVSAILVTLPSFSQKRKVAKYSDTEYVVLASSAVKGDKAWMEVVNALKRKYRAKVVFFDKVPRESLATLKELCPRYVAIVEIPGNIGRDYVIDVNKMSRQIDDDIYADYLCGIF